MRQFILILFIVILYTQGLGKTLGIPEEFFKLVLIGLSFSFLFLQNKKLKIPPGTWLVVSYSLWATYALYFNDEPIFQGYMFSRYLIMGFLVYFTVYNSYFSYRKLRTIHTTIFALFCLQVFAAVVEIVFFERTEAIVGTMVNDSGGLATTFPMFAFCFFFSAYLFAKKRKLLLLFFAVSFFLVGFASGKLGVYFLIPILGLIGYILYLRVEKLPLFNRQTFAIILVFGFLALFIAFIIPLADTRTERLNLGNLSPLERIEAFVSFAETDNEMIVDGYTISRQATSMRIIEETFKRPPEVFLFGQGFTAYQAIGQTLGEGAYEEYGIVYGITGWSYDALVMGWPGILFHVLFFVVIFRKTMIVYKKSKLSLFGKAIIFACLLNFFTFLLNYFFYNYNFTVGGCIICIHMYFSGLILAPQYRHLFTYQMKKKFHDEGLDDYMNGYEVK